MKLASLTWSQHSCLRNGSFLQDAIDKDVSRSVLDGTADSLHGILDQSHSFDTCERQQSIFNCTYERHV